MKKRFYALILCLLVVLISLNGCTEFLFDDDSNNEKIPVKVIASATVYNASGEPVPGVEVQFDLSKTYGQDFRAYRTTDDYGYAVVNQYAYDLYNGQVITVRCYISAHSIIDEKTATYNQFLPDMETHSSTAWYPSFEFTLDR